MKDKKITDTIEVLLTELEEIDYIEPDTKKLMRVYLYKKYFYAN